MTAEWQQSVAAAIELDTRHRCLIGPLGAVKLSPQTLCLLRRLMKSNGDPVTDDELAAALWSNPDHEPDSSTNVIRVSIFHLRTALQSAGSPAWIENVRGRGYRLLAVEIPPGEPDHVLHRKLTVTLQHMQASLQETVGRLAEASALVKLIHANAVRAIANSKDTDHNADV